MLFEDEGEDEDAEAEMLETAEHIEQVLARVKTGTRPREEPPYDDEEEGTLPSRRDLLVFDQIYRAHFGTRWEG